MKPENKELLKILGIMFLKSLFLLIVLCACANTNSNGPSSSESCVDTTPTDTDPTKDDILIIGDSISIGYTPFVQSNLFPLEVIHNPCNAMTVVNGLAEVNYWMNMRHHYKLIAFNHGMWDLALSTGESTIVYANDLRQEALILLQHTDKVIFFTTTYVMPNVTDHPYNSQNDYNTAAITVMNSLGIPVYDLYAESRTIDNQHPTANDVHYTYLGYSILGDFVTQSIKTELGI